MTSFFGFGSKKSPHDSDSSRTGESKLTQSSDKSQKSLKGSFESLNSMDLGFSQSKTCYICSKNFNFRKKHFCKFCMNAVCSDHSSKVRIKEGMNEPQRICDFCDQDEEKSQIKHQIDDEVSKLGEELKAAKETNEKLYKEHFEKATIVSNLEEDLNLKTVEHSERMKKIAKEIQEKKENKIMMTQKLEKLKLQLQITKENQVKMRENSEIMIKKNKDLQEECISSHKEMIESQKELKKVENFIKKSLNTSNFASDLCGKCKIKLDDSLNRFKVLPSWESSAEEEKK